MWFYCFEEQKQRAFRCVVAKQISLSKLRSLWLSCVVWHKEMMSRHEPLQGSQHLMSSNLGTYTLTSTILRTCFSRSTLMVILGHVMWAVRNSILYTDSADARWRVISHAAHPAPIEWGHHWPQRPIGVNGTRQYMRALCLLSQCGLFGKNHRSGHDNTHMLSSVTLIFSFHLENWFLTHVSQRGVPKIKHFFWHWF